MVCQQQIEDSEKTPLEFEDVAEVMMIDEKLEIFGALLQVVDVASKNV